jgi:hypothetical protein
MRKKGGEQMDETAVLEAEEPAGLDETDQEDSGLMDGGDEFHAGKIYCANCIHCKLVLARTRHEAQYVQRIRCAAGKWKKKLGEEKLYKYCTITRRYLDSCDAYDEMGDTRTFVRELRKKVPNKDELYTLAEEGAPA